MSIEQKFEVDSENDLAPEAARILTENPEDSLIIMGVNDETRQRIRQALKEISQREVLNGTNGRFFDDLFRYGSTFQGNTILHIDTDHTPGLLSKLENPQPFAAGVLRLKESKTGVQVVITTPLPDAEQSIDAQFHHPLDDYYKQRTRKADGKISGPTKPSVTNIRFHVLSTENPINYSIKDLNPFRKRS